MRSDEQLVALFRAGSEDAFGVIHDRYRGRLFAYARQMLAGSQSDAEDAIQDVFIRAYGSLRNGNRPIALRPWLYRVAHNRCIDQLRRPAAQTTELWDGAGTPAEDPMHEAERREDLRRLVEDVRRLPEQQRSALLMRELEGLSYEDLAAAHDTSVAAIKSLLVRARVGLVQAAEARDAACSEIRHELALAHGRGVRANGRSRRHLRDCSGCREYRSELRRVERSFAALYPAGPLAALANLLGLGGSGGGAGAGGAGAAAGTSGAASAGTGAFAAGTTGAAASTGAAAVGGTSLGGVAAAATATKVAAVVASVVVTGGAAVQVERHFVKTDSARPAIVAPAVHDSTASPSDAPVLSLPPTDEATTPAPVLDAPAPETAPAAPTPSASDAGTGCGASGSGTDPVTGGTSAPADSDSAAPDVAQISAEGTSDGSNEDLAPSEASAPPVTPIGGSGSSSAQPPATPAPASPQPGLLKHH